MSSRKSVASVFLFIVCFCSIVLCLTAQPTGFISIDCGSAYNYTDSLGIFWNTDNAYVSTGQNAIVATANSHLGPDRSQNVQKLATTRYFPEVRSKHCYVIPEVQRKSLYFIRLMFLGANLTSGQNVQFGLTVGNLYWTVVNISDSFTPLIKEINYITQSKTPFSICLIRLVGTPFISSLELRPLPGSSYQTNDTANAAITNLFRWNCGTTPGTKSLRYPDDPYDRIWTAEPAGFNFTKIRNSSAEPDNTSGNLPPVKALQSAWAAPVTGFINFTWNVPVKPAALLAFFYYSDILTRAPNDTMVLHTSNDDATVSIDPIDVSLKENQVFTILVTTSSVTSFSIYADKNSTLGPILNAVELYDVTFFNFSYITSALDVDAIGAIQGSLNLTDWTGDPCLPVAWDWLKCSSPEATTKSRILQINLSQYNLTGTIPPQIGQLTELTDLSLDNNNLTGTIPNITYPTNLQTIRLQNNHLKGSIPVSLAELPNLNVLTLDNNMLVGDVPQGLLTKIDDSSLTFSAAGNPYLCFGGNICAGVPSPSPSESKSGKSSSSTGIIIGVIAGVVVVLLLVGSLFCWYKIKSAPKSTTSSPTDLTGRVDAVIMNHHSQQAKHFSLMEVKDATDNFATVIGEGGFGSVYYGKLPGGQEVAVKVNKKNTEGIAEFLNEVALLSRVHHRNLVSLVGYCEELDQQILIYAYMHKGTLQDQLNGGSEQGISLDWKTRLDIAINAAQGLEYLHSSCSPPIIHRDIKSNNILLTDKLVAKVADFGISRITTDALRTQGVTTEIKGTYGYLDPEYFLERRLTTKSDVYSFGVVLLELITGKNPLTPIISGATVSTLQDWVLTSVREGNIYAVLDPRMKGNYNLESIWKVVELALMSLHREGARRPDMADIVRGLRDAMDFQDTHSGPPGLPEHSPSQLPPADFDRYQRVHNASRGSRGSRSSNESIATHSWGSNVTAR